jgi:nitrite reductase/ring-hydroxylating ferredoxin subunit
MQWIRVARLSALREGHGTRVIAEGEEIALWLVDGTVYAVSNLCAHQHLPSMYDAMRDGISITCPNHGWTFSLDSGIEENGRGRLRTFEVRIEGDDVFVMIEG